jgi:hypothetical protein
MKFDEPRATAVDQPPHARLPTHTCQHTNSKFCTAPSFTFAGPQKHSRRHSIPCHRSCKERKATLSQKAPTRTNSRPHVSGTALSPARAAGVLGSQVRR